MKTAAHQTVDRRFAPSVSCVDLFGSSILMWPAAVALWLRATIIRKHRALFQNARAPRVPCRCIIAPLAFPSQDIKTQHSTASLAWTAFSYPSRACVNRSNIFPRSPETRHDVIEQKLATNDCTASDPVFNNTISNRRSLQRVRACLRQKANAFQIAPIFRLPRLAISTMVGRGQVRGLDQASIVLQLGALPISRSRQASVRTASRTPVHGRPSLSQMEIQTAVSLQPQTNLRRAAHLFLTAAR